MTKSGIMDEPSALTFDDDSDELYFVTDSDPEVVSDDTGRVELWFSPNSILVQWMRRLQDIFA